MKDLELQNHGFTFQIRKMESSLDICDCGDYRKDHPDNGPCSLNGLGHGIPNYNCERFHQENKIMKIRTLKPSQKKKVQWLVSHPELWKDWKGMFEDPRRRPIVENMRKDGIVSQSTYWKDVDLNKLILYAKSEIEKSNLTGLKS